MAIKINNNGSSLLSSSLATGDTTLSVTSGEGLLFPVLSVGDYFYATLQDVINNIEIIKVTARTTDAMTIVRAQEGTTARAWNGGDLVEQRITAQTLADSTSDAVTLAVALKVSKSSNTGSAILPSSTTANRDVSPVAGYLRYNTTLAQFEGYNGTAWGAVGAGATGGIGNAAFYENDQTITVDYTLTANKNAMSAGPITISNSATVTIPTGATWSIV